jgi:predicted small secreted protein
MKILAVAALLVLTACNTVQGVGKDVQVVGSAIERSADKK